MGLRDDLRRFEEVGEERRDDLADFIRYGDLGPSDAERVRIPIKIVELPEFVYDFRDRGGVGEGDPEPGDPVGAPEPGDGGDEPGDTPGEHGHYEMDPAEFAAQLDEALGLELEPKGKAVVERTEGAFTDRARVGPDSTLDLNWLFREALKRKLVLDFDESFMREVLRVEGIDPDTAYRWAREERIPVGRKWLVDEYADIPCEERDRWPSIETVEAELGRTPIVERIRREGFDHLPIRREDERYRHPEIVEERQKNVVVVNIRDVSGSMGADKRELVERTFTPLDWYLQGKYDHAEFIYIAHDAEAWEVDRESFFGITSGGGTRISSAYELAQERLEAYPWTEWNRFIFAAGDSQNASRDTADRVIPLIENINANQHVYLETRPGERAGLGRHARALTDHFEDAEDVVVSVVNRPDDVIEAITEILTREGEET